MRAKKAISFVWTMLVVAFLAEWPIALYAHVLVPDDYGDTNPRGDMACAIAELVAALLIGFLYAYRRRYRMQIEVRSVLRGDFVSSPLHESFFLFWTILIAAFMAFSLIALATHIFIPSNF
jgi:hypothetical protein